MLPANASPQARVRCPLCRDEYTLSEALAKMPPMLIVVDAGPAPAYPQQSAPAYSQAEAGTGYAEPEYQVAGDAGGMFDSSPAEGDSPAMPASPTKFKPKKKKKEAGVVAMIVQVVLGGLCAVVLFHLIAWWTPLLGYTDPMGAAPPVRKYVKFLVPDSVMANSYGLGPDGRKLAATENPKPIENPKPNNNKPADNKKKNNDFQIPDPSEKLDPLDPGPAPVIPTEPEDPAMDPKGIDFKIPMPKPFVPPTPPTDPAPPVDPAPPKPAPKASSAMVTTAYAEAVSKREDFESETDATVRRQKGKDLYDAVANLGKFCADADMTDGENADKVALIKEELGSKIGKFAIMLALFSDQRLADGATEDGIAVSGVIKDIKPLGATHETTIEVTRPNKTLFTIPVVTTKSLEDDGAKVGDTLIVLGKIVRDPKKDLPAYKGEAPQLIHAGHVTLPAAP